MNDGDLQYLSRGTRVQQAALRCLRSLNMMQILSPYNPFLCGTIPINIDIRDSDLDIICEVSDFQAFEQHLRRHFDRFPDFSVSLTESPSGNMLTAAFTHLFTLEIFGQALPVRQQYAYRHMMQEARVLSLASEAFRLEIIHLKEAGLSTEAAFASLLQLSGDPYEAVLDLEHLSEDQLRAFIRQKVR